jgi:membrane dipeptidase
VAYVGQVPDFTPEGFARAHENVMTKFDAIHRLCNELAPDRCELATTAADVRRIKAAGKSAILIGVENGYSVGEDITNVEKFYNLGARYMSLAHNGHSHLVDSHTGESDGDFPNNGLSPLGREVIKEMNRLGMMVDISHPSKEGNRQTIELSRAPVIASHSSARALASSSRNLEDDELRAVAATGGVVQTVAFNSFVKDPLPDSPERAAAVAELRKTFDLAPEGGMTRQQMSVQQRAECVLGNPSSVLNARGTHMNSAALAETQIHGSVHRAGQDLPASTTRDRLGFCRPHRSHRERDWGRPLWHQL